MFVAVANVWLFKLICITRYCFMQNLTKNKDFANEEPL